MSDNSSNQNSNAQKVKVAPNQDAQDAQDAQEKDKKRQKMRNSEGIDDLGGVNTPNSGGIFTMAATADKADAAMQKQNAREVYGVEEATNRRNSKLKDAAKYAAAAAIVFAVVPILGVPLVFCAVYKGAQAGMANRAVKGGERNIAKDEVKLRMQEQNSKKLSEEDLLNVASISSNNSEQDPYNNISIAKSMTARYLLQDTGLNKNKIDALSIKIANDSKVGTDPESVAKAAETATIKFKLLNTKGNGSEIVSDANSVEQRLQRLKSIGAPGTSNTSYYEKIKKHGQVTESNLNRSNASARASNRAAEEEEGQDRGAGGSDNRDGSPEEKRQDSDYRGGGNGSRDETPPPSYDSVYENKKDPSEQQGENISTRGVTFEGLETVLSVGSFGSDDDSSVASEVGIEDNSKKRLVDNKLIGNLSPPRTPSSPSISPPKSPGQSNDGAAR